MITDEGFDVGLKLCVWAAPHTQMQQLHQRRLLLAFILIPVLAYGSLQQVWKEKKALDNTEKLGRSGVSTWRSRSVWTEWTSCIT